MTDNERQKTIDSWHMRADAYEILVAQYQIFTDMAMGLVNFVKKHRESNNEDLHIMDLAAGTGLVSKLLIDCLHISPSSLYIIEPAERMCVRARDNIKTPYVYQTAAEDCLSTFNLPEDYFDFILCNASMHLMSDNEIYPIVSKLLKPKTGYFLYTLWYHAFDETEHYDANEELEICINDVLTYFNYPKYFSLKKKGTSTSNRSIRSRKSLEETAHKNGLKLVSCTIHNHQIPMSFDLDFLLMTPSWLIEHLKNYEWTQNQDVYSMKEDITEKVRELIKDKYTEKPVVQVVVSKII
jgi:SAM-dependent methyltransferase